MNKFVSTFDFQNKSVLEIPADKFSRSDRGKRDREEERKRKKE